MVLPVGLSSKPKDVCVILGSVSHDGCVLEGSLSTETWGAVAAFSAKATISWLWNFLSNPSKLHCVLIPPIPFASTVRMQLNRWQQFYFSYNLTSPFTMGNYRDQTQNPFLFLLYRCSSPQHFQQATSGQRLDLICGPPFGAASARAGGAVFVCSTVCIACREAQEATGW